MGVSNTQDHTKHLDKSIDKIFFQNYKDQPPYVKKVANYINLGDHQGSEYKIAQLSSVGNMRTKTEGEAITFDELVEGNQAALSPTEYHLGLQFTRRLLKDDIFKNFMKAPAELGKSARYKQDTQFWDLFNSGFATHTAWDGGYIFASSGRTTLKSGDSMNNATTAALSATSLQAALQYGKTAKNTAGRFMKLTPWLLVVPPALDWKAKELEMTPKKVDSMDNNINTVQGEGWRRLMVPHLSSSTAWFLLFKEHDFTFMWREPVMTESMDDFHTGNYLYKVYCAFGVKCFDPVGGYGSTGA